MIASTRNETSIRNFIYDLPPELLNDLRRTVLEIKEILKKSQNCMRTQPIFCHAQSPLQI